MEHENRIEEGHEADSKAEWAYAGQYQLKGGGLGHLWHEIGPDGQPEEEKAHVFKGKNIARHAGVGGVFLVTLQHRKGGAVSAVTAGPNAPRYLRSLPDSDTVRGWAAESQLQRTQRELDSLTRKEGRDRLDSMTLADLAGMSRRMLPERRRALVAYVLSRMGV